MTKIPSAPTHVTLCREIELHHTSGEILHPYAKKSRSTGRSSFVVAKSGAGSNKREAEQYIDDPAALALSVRNGMMVRCRAVGSARNGLYSPTGRSITRVVINGRELPR